jgi:hypothetical protein
VAGIDNARRLLLVSNSTPYGSGYLDHIEDEIKDFLRNTTRTIFVPFAVHDRRAYAAKTRERLHRMGFDLRSIHDVSNMRREINEADSIFVGGGNTFRHSRVSMTPSCSLRSARVLQQACPISDQVLAPSWHVPP